MSWLAWVDPRVAWRDLRVPPRAGDDVAKALRTIAYLVFAVGLACWGVFVATIVALAFVLVELGASFDLVELLRIALLFLVVLLPLPLVVRPFAAFYAREAQGEPNPRWALVLTGLVAAALTLFSPILFALAFFVLDDFFVLVGSFLGTALSPWLGLSAWRLLKG